MKYSMRTWIFICLVQAFCACHRKTKADAQAQVLHQNCQLRPEAGPCRMAVKRYYYDPVEKKCKEFTYGGCKGIVPFETLEACKKGCGCE